jgi:hypothetical protein
MGRRTCLPRPSSGQNPQHQIFVANIVVVMVAEFDGIADISKTPQAPQHVRLPGPVRTCQEGEASELKPGADMVPVAVDLEGLDHSAGQESKPHPRDRQPEMRSAGAGWNPLRRALSTLEKPASFPYNPVPCSSTNQRPAPS